MITLQGLTKRFGDKEAVTDLSLQIHPGKVTGFLGPNGAGKSTTMRMIMGLDHPTAGTALIDGEPYARLRTPLRHVGALLDSSGAQPGRTAAAHLHAIAASNRIARSRVDEVLDLVGLTAVARKRVKGFSLGMGQRLGIAAALLGDPPMLLFDEPVNGLDPDGVRWIRELMRTLAAEGRTVFVSSHLMSEMQETADHLILLGRGRLLADAPLREVIESSSLQATRVRSPELALLKRELISAGLTVESGVDATLIVTGATLDQIGDFAFQAGLPLHELSPRSASLEEAYLELTTGQAEYITATTSNSPTMQETQP